MIKPIHYMLSVAFLVSSVAWADDQSPGERQQKAHHKTSKNEKRNIAKPVRKGSLRNQAEKDLANNYPANQQFGDPNRPTQLQQSRMNQGNRGLISASPTPLVTPTAFPTF